MHEPSDWVCDYASIQKLSSSSANILYNAELNGEPSTTYRMQKT